MKLRRFTRTTFALGLGIALVLAAFVNVASAAAGQPNVLYYTATYGGDFFKSETMIIRSGEPGSVSQARIDGRDVYQATKGTATAGSAVVYDTGLAVEDLESIVVRGNFATQGTNWLNLWFNIDGNDEYFAYDSEGVLTGFAGDKYAFLLAPAPTEETDRAVIIDGATRFRMSNTTEEFSLAELASDSTSIPKEAKVALWIGVEDSSDASEQLSISVHSVFVNKPSEVWVDDSWSTATVGQIIDGHIFGYDAFETIGEALQGVADDGKINVAAGSYPEALTIDKSVELVGASGDTTLCPTGSVGIAVKVTGSGVEAKITGFVIDGTNLMADATPFLAGIVVRDGAHCDIHDNTIQSIKDPGLSGSGNQRGYGIWVGGAATADITENTISDYQKNGIVVIDDQSYAYIDGNMITGAGQIDYIGQNGIVVRGGATADIVGNTISRHWYIPDTDEATGILLYLGAGEDGTVVGNTIMSNELGVVVCELSSIPGVGTNSFGQGDTANGANCVAETTGWPVPEELYVNPGYDGAEVGVVLSSDPPAVMGYNAFATVQEAVNAVANNGTVYVMAGDYDENVTVPADKHGITLQGEVGPSPGYELLSRIRGAVGESYTLTLLGSQTTVQNLVIEKGETDNEIGVAWGYQGVDSTLIGCTVQGYTTGVYLSSGVDGVTLADNLVTGNANGILFEGELSNTTISGNTITGNILEDTDEYWVGLNKLNAGIRALPGYQGTNVVISRNTISEVVRGIDNNSLNAIDARGNWWGTLTGSVIAQHVVGNVEFDPWYSDDNWSGLLSDEAATNITKAKSYGTIQEAIDDADDGNTIEVAAGTYNESIELTKSVKLHGANVGNDPNVGEWDEGNRTTLTGGIARSYSVESYEDVEIMGFDFTGKGILFVGSGNLLTFDGLTISNNRFTDISYGVDSNIAAIHFNMDETDTMKDLTITSNRIVGVTGKDPSGISVFVCSGNTNITHNHIEGVNHNSIQVTTKATGDLNISDNILKDWDVDNAGDGGRAVRLNGVTASDASTTTVARNVMVKTDPQDGYIKVTASGPVDARLNYWNGTIPTESVDSVDGTGVEFDPYYSDEPLTLSSLAWIGPVRNTTKLKSYATIQAAINAASGGDTILVAPDTYYENILIDGKNITLLSVEGRENTIIEPTLKQSNAIQIRGVTTGVRIGAPGQGFKIVGAEPTNQGIETSAIYLGPGTIADAVIEGNEVVAGGGSAILTEYGGAVVSNLAITGNVISGQTFLGEHPAGLGSSQQYTLFNVPRSLVYIAGNYAGDNNKSNITFTGNQVIGIAGGMNDADPPKPQGNTLATIDSVGATITGNTFMGNTAYNPGLRARGTDTVISGNTFASGPLLGQHVSLNADTVEGGVDTVIAENTFDRAAYVVGGTMVFTKVQLAVDAAVEGNTVHVTAGTYNESVSIPAGKNGLKLIGAGSSTTTIVAATGNAVSMQGNVSIDSSNKPLTNYTVEGFTLQAPNGTGFIALSGTPNATTPYYTKGLTLKDIVVAGSSSRHGIILNATDGATLDNVKVKNVHYATDPIGALELTGVKTLVVKDSTFQGNDIGIRLQRTDVPPGLNYGANGPVTITKTTFLTNAVAVENQDTVVTVAATSNYWGTGGSSPASHVMGNVTYNPWYVRSSMRQQDLSNYVAPDDDDDGGTPSTPPPTPPQPPVIAGAVSQDIPSTQGGTVALEDNSAKVELPAGAVQENVTITLSPVVEMEEPTTGMVMIGGKVYEITAETVNGEHVTTFSQPLTLTFTFTEDELEASGTAAEDLRVFYWDAKAGAWIALPTTVDPVTGTVTALTDHFTLFALMAKPDMPALRDIAGHWSETHVLRLVSLGVVGGYDDGSYKPENVITREEFAKMVVLAAGLEADAEPVLTFADADEIQPWARGYVSAAVNAGIISGLPENRFGPAEMVTKEQAATMIARALGLEVGAVGGATTFADDSEIQSYARAGVQLAVEEGIITGNPDNTFRPGANTTRAEAATMLSKLMGVLAE